MRYLTILLWCMATLFSVACHEEAYGENREEADNEIAESISITIKTEETSRTALDMEAQRVQWSSSDKIIVVENGTHYATSSTTTIDDMGRASFVVTLDKSEAEEYFYDALYPAESVAISKGAINEVVSVTLPAEQHPTATSFDPMGDILVTQRVVCSEQPSELNMRFKRLVALGELSLTNLPAECYITSVTLRMDDNKTLAGVNRVNCAEGKVVEYGYDRPSSTLRLIYDEPIDADGAIYFTCNPLTINAGDEFEVEVTTSEGATYKRNVTIPEGRTLTFNEGNLNLFSVDMSSTITDEKPDEQEPLCTFHRVTKVTSGKAYLLAAEGYIATPLVDNDYGYLQIAEGDTDNDGVITLKNCNNAFVIEATNGGYTIRQAIDNRYIYQYNNYNSFNVDVAPNQGNVWSISAYNSDNSFTIKNSSKNKFIQYNGDYDSFGSYSKLQSEGVRPMLYELDGDIVLGEDEEGEDGSDEGGDTPVVTPTGEWLELPAEPDMSKYPNAVTVTIMDGNERNYTHFYDKSTYTTMWVAYPLESKHMGSYSRPSNWDWNPYIDQAYQVNLCNRSYTDSDVHVRGHLIPNASRNGIKNMQIQTFYVTNSVPQVHTNFNSGIWQNLEAALQGIGEKELIYIVTGVAFNKEGESKTISYTTAKDDTKQVPIPNYFYKVVLKVDTNSSGEVTAASTVGFWFENKAYSGSAYENYTTTVDQIEAWTGFDFFTNLPDTIETTAEQNSSWSTFKNW